MWAKEVVLPLFMQDSVCMECTAVRARARARMVRLSGNVRHVYFTNDTAARMYDFVGRMNEIMARAPVRLGFFEGP